MRRVVAAVLAVSVVWCGCGGGGVTSTSNSSAPLQAQISIAPQTPQLRAGSTQQFTAQVSNTSSSGLIWAVNGTAGGSSALGTIDSNGLYTAPASLPTPNTVSISVGLSSNSSVTASTLGPF